jgi:hypothetical protein
LEGDDVVQRELDINLEGIEALVGFVLERGCGVLIFKAPQAQGCENCQAEQQAGK